MSGQSPSPSTAGISADFGYYPNPINLVTDQFSICTLPDLEKSVASIQEDEGVYDNWLYPGPQRKLDIENKRMVDLPCPSRIFGLPKTHTLTLHHHQSQDDIEFVIWCLSFFVGMRLTTTERGFLDATPLEPGTLVDFNLRNCTLEDAVQLALDYLKRESADPDAPNRIVAVIHTLFLAQYRQSLPFEQFQYLYIALDGCFQLLKVKEEPKFRKSHADRIQWMCEKFGIAIPSWAEVSSESGRPESTTSVVRNDSMHEGRFFGQPLGFAIYGGNANHSSSENVPYQMQKLVCRLLIAILGKPNISYVSSCIKSRMIQGLELNA